MFILLLCMSLHTSYFILFLFRTWCFSRLGSGEKEIFSDALQWYLENARNAVRAERKDDQNLIEKLSNMEMIALKNPRFLLQRSRTWNATPVVGIKIQNPAGSHNRGAQCCSSHTKLHSYITRAAPAKRNNSLWTESSSDMQREARLTQRFAAFIIKKTWLTKNRKQEQPFRRGLTELFL